MSKQISPQTKKYWIRWHSHAAYHASLTKENEYPHRTRKWEGRVGRKLMMQKRWNRVNCHCLFEILSLFCVCCSSRYSSTCSLSQIWYLFHTPHIARSSNKNADTRTKWGNWKNNNVNTTLHSKSKYKNTHTHTHTHTFSLSLSLTFSHTHAHTQEGKLYPRISWWCFHK